MSSRPALDAALMLADVPLFRGAAPGTLEQLVREGTVRRVEAGQWLFREGDPADGLYVVQSGRLRAVIVRDGEARVARELGPGAALGELALLTGSTRSAGIQAIRDSELLEVSRSRFMGLLESDPAFGQVVAVELARQLQESGGLAAPSSRKRVFAVVPLDGDVDAERFAATLGRELEKQGTVATLRAGATADPYPSLLARAESSADFVLLVSSSRADEPWSAFARRQADRVVFLAGSETPVMAVEAGCDLVLFGPLPTGRVAAWLDGSADAISHLVYEAGYDLGVARVARRISGRALGLVLSGGGARGLAHIGVLRALAGAGFEIDRLGGCSMGSYIAGMSALGLDADQIQERCRDELVRRAPFNDWTLPRVSLIRSRKATRMLERVFGDLQVEELPRPFYTVSADLLSSRIVVHRRGSMRDAVRASMSIPGLVPPFARSGRLLIDGGVLNNLPVDLMHEADEGPIVAVDVVRRLDTAADATPQMPSIMETMSRATVLGSVERAERNRGLATLIVSPEVNDIGLFAFKSLDRAVAAGEEAAAAALEDGGADALRAALA